MTTPFSFGGSWRRASAAIFILLTVGARAALAEGPGVHGRVLGHEADGGTKRVAQATIEFKDQGGHVAATTTTNEQGYYKADLPAGVYSYKVQAAGYKDLDIGRGISLQLTE